MKNIVQIKQSLRQRRIFSEEIRKSIVKDIESGKCTAMQAKQEIGVSLASIYKWINKYSRYLKSNRVLVVQNKSELYRTRELESRLKDLEAALGRKQMEIDFLNKLIEIAEKESGVLIKKNSQNSHLDGLGPQKTINTDMP